MIQTGQTERKREEQVGLDALGPRRSETDKVQCCLWRLLYYAVWGAVKDQKVQISLWPISTHLE